MSIRRIWTLLALIAIFSIASFAHAGEENTRYFVKSNAPFWKKSLNIRHAFGNGFTADLTDWQLKLTKIFGIEVEQVKKLNILDDQLALKGKVVEQFPTEKVPWGIKAIYGDSFIEKSAGGKGVNVAILDTGIVKHKDLESNIKECKDFSSLKPIVDGKCEDKDGHGTHVAGIIAANGGADKKGIWGMAPEASIYAYKVCSNSGTCWADDVAAAIRTATYEGANIINISLGSDTKSDIIADAIAYAIEKGVLVVAAAGNDGPYSDSIDYPASDKNVVSVGVVDSDLLVPEWTARGINEETDPYIRNEGDMDFAAPGVDIESTWKDGGYLILSGTSMSAPHISGLAAKLWQTEEKNSAKETLSVIKRFAEDILTAGDDNYSGWGFPIIK